MSLPVIRERPAHSVELSEGIIVTFRGLTRAEALSNNAYLEEQNDAGIPSGETVAELEARMISQACEVPLADARQWHSSLPNGVAQKIVEAISEVSGLTPDLGNGSPAN